MKHFFLITILELVITAAFAQSDPVVMTVNGVPVSRSEFEYSSNKNNTEGVVDRKTVAEYADLYAIYKMKVQAALDERMDTLSCLIYASRTLRVKSLFGIFAISARAASFLLSSNSWRSSSTVAVPWKHS